MQFTVAVNEEAQKGYRRKRQRTRQVDKVLKLKCVE